MDQKGYYIVLKYHQEVDGGQNTWNCQEVVRIEEYFFLILGFGVLEFAENL